MTDAEKKAQWDAALAEIQKMLDPVRVHGGAQVYEDIPPATRDFFKKLSAERWENDRIVYTFGRVDTDRMIRVCRAELYLWWPLATGCAVRGDVEGLKRVFDAMPKENANPSSIMTWLSFPNNVAPGVPAVLDPATLDVVFELGADPNTSDGKWLREAATKLPRENIACFIRHGADLSILYDCLSGLKKAGKSDRAHILEAAMGEGCFYTLSGADTLVQTRLMPAAEGLCSLRHVFNFAAREVIDIYEPARSQPPVVSWKSFDDCPLPMIEAAGRKLEALGGTLPQTVVPLPKIARAAGLGAGRGPA